MSDDIFPPVERILKRYVNMFTIGKVKEPHKMVLTEGIVPKIFATSENSNGTAE